MSNRLKRVWCWGAGWDSTAGIIEDVRRGIPIDMITFADHGGEKRTPDTELGEQVGTYEFIPIFTEWLVERGYPAPVRCVYTPKPETHARYAAAAREVVERLNLKTIDEATIQRLAGIYGNMVGNATLTGLAFGGKSCSVKWKIEALGPHRVDNPLLQEAWLNGERVQKCIGFDATEDHRVKGTGGGGTYAVGNFAICNRKGLPAFSGRYSVLYPLREYGFDRPKCGRVIADAGLPVPPKSACFFCPAMRLAEIQRLQIIDPEYAILAFEMERIYRGGKNFRGDSMWTVKAVRKDTREKVSFDCEALTSQGAKDAFRVAYDDTVRPYRYTLSATAAVPGLGRSFAWTDYVQLQLPGKM